MTKIEFYRMDYYPSWEAARENGAVHSKTLHEADEHSDEVLSDVLHAIHMACKMMDVNYKVDTRVVKSNPINFQLYVWAEDVNDIVRIIWANPLNGETGFTQIEAFKAQTEINFLTEKGCRIHFIGPAIDNTSGEDE